MTPRVGGHTSLGTRFKDALVFSTEAHQGQVRKGGGIPYISHPLAVASLVLEYGGTEDQAIAALLHDTIEDCSVTQEELESRFGALVAQIVVECSDSTTQPKPPWKERKERYIEHLSHARDETLLVSACDKLHNARAIVHDVRVDGNTVWNRFSATPLEIVCYYESLLKVYGTRLGAPIILKRLFDELSSVVTEMKVLVST